MPAAQIGIILASFLIAIFIFFGISGIRKNRKRRQERTAIKPVSETAEMISAVIEPEEKPPEEPIIDNTVNYCPKCGARLNEEMIYCRKCGHQVPHRDESKVITMCINHPEREATKFCDNCGRPLCRECTVILSENNYCRPCIQILLKDRDSSDSGRTQGSDWYARNKHWAYIVGLIMGIVFFVVMWSSIGNAFVFTFYGIIEMIPTLLFSIVVGSIVTFLCYGIINLIIKALRRT